MNRKHTLIQLLALVVLGGAVFLYKLGYPADIVFDESYHIPAAQKYLHGVLFSENHPPLGKLFIALGEKIWHRNRSTDQFVLMDTVQGDYQKMDFFGYRFFPALFGLFSVIILYLILDLVIPNRLVRFAVSLTALFDNAMVTQARTAVLDSSLVFFVLLTILLSLKTEKQERPGIGWFVLLGLTSAGSVLVKHTGWIILIAVAPAMVKLMRLRGRKALARLMAFLVAFGLLYTGVWGIHYRGKVVSGARVEVDQKILEWKNGKIKLNPVELALLQAKDGWSYSRRYNQNVPPLDLCKKDEIGSPWYYWPFGGRGISYRLEVDGDSFKHRFLIGNPVVWLVSLVGVILSLGWLIGRGVFRVRAAAKSSRYIGYFGLLYVGYMVPFLFIRRVMYFYHYLPAMLFGLILFALLLMEIRQIGKLKLNGTKRAYLALVILGFVFVSFIIFAPLTYYLPVSKEYMRRINLLPIWNTDFQQQW